MAIDFAELGIKVKFDDVGRATVELDKLTTAGNRAEQATNKLGSATRTMSSAAENGTRGMGAWAAIQSEATNRVGEHSLSIGRLGYRLESLTTDALGANSAVGLLGATFLRFGLGDVYTIAILGGIYAVVKAYELLTDGSKKARDENNKLIESLEKAIHLKGLGPGGETVDQVRAAAAEANQLLAERYRLNQGLLLQPREGASPMAAQALLHAQELARQRLDEIGIELQNLRNTEAGGASIINEKTGDALAEATRKRAEEATKADAAFQKEIDTLAKGLVFQDQRKRVTAELIGIEHQLEAQVNSGTLGLEKRTIALERLGVVMDALSRKFIVDPRITNAGQLIGITGSGETAAARAYSAYGGATTNVGSGRVVPLNSGLIGEQQKDYLGSGAYDLAKRFEALTKPFDAAGEAAYKVAKAMKDAADNIALFKESWKRSNIGGGIAAGAGSGVSDALMNFTPQALAYQAVSAGLNYIVSGFEQMAVSLFDGGASAREAARAHRQLVDEYKAAAASFRHDDLAAALAQDAAAFEQLMKQTQQAIGTAFDIIKNGFGAYQKANADNAAQEARNQALIKQQSAENQQYAQEDLAVRNLRATGRGDQADLIAFQEKQAREYQAAQEKALADGIVTAAEALYLNTLAQTDANELIAFQNGLLQDALRNAPTGFYGVPGYTRQFATPEGPGGVGGHETDAGIVRPKLHGGFSGSGNSAPPRGTPVHIQLNLDGKVLTTVFIDNIDQHAASTNGTGTSRSAALDTMPR